MTLLFRRVDIYLCRRTYLDCAGTSSVWRVYIQGVFSEASPTASVFRDGHQARGETCRPSTTRIAVR